jgi:uncharacterized protein YcbK (DUF882 family)
MNLTKNFTLEELYRSATATSKKIDNTPNSEITAKLTKLAKEILQPIRDELGKPIRVTSGYRSPKLNTAVGGSKTSQHMKGEAADLQLIGGKNAELFNVIKNMINSGKLKVGQLIWEYGTKTEPNWVHVSLPYSKVNNILYLYSK